MKKLFYPFIAFAMTMMIPNACQKESQILDEKIVVPEGSSCFVPLDLSVELYDFEKDYYNSVTGTKSDMASAIEKSVPSDMNYYLFKNGALVGQKYISDITKFGVSLPDKSASYNLYLLANVGQKVLGSGTTEASLGGSLQVNLGSQSDFVNNCNEKGFPTCKKIEGFSVSSSKSINLERLVHTLNVKIDKDALEDLSDKGTNITFTSLAVRQAARDIYPFATASKCTSTLAISGDTGLSTTDLARLNNGESVVLYVAENMRGDCLPGITDWKDKVPGNFTNPNDSQLATFIELEAQIETSTASYNKVIYRAYLGNKASNCDVKRNEVSTITNVFLNEMIESEDWRIDSSEPSIRESLYFVMPNKYEERTPSDERITSHLEYMPGEQACGQEGSDNVYLTGDDGYCLVYVYRSNPQIEFSINIDTQKHSRHQKSSDEQFQGDHNEEDEYEWDDNGEPVWEYEAPFNVSYQVADVNDHYVAILFETNGYFKVPVTVSSKDGLISDSFILQVNNTKPSVYFGFRNNEFVINVLYARPIQINGRVSGTFAYNGPVSSLTYNDNIYPAFIESSNTSFISRFEEQGEYVYEVIEYDQGGNHDNDVWGYVWHNGASYTIPQAVERANNNNTISVNSINIAITDYYAFYKPIGFYHKAGTFVVSDYSTLNSITCNGVQIPVSMTVNGSAYKPGTTAISHTFGSPAVLTSYPSEWGSTWRSVKEYEGGK